MFHSKNKFITLKDILTSGVTASMLLISLMITKQTAPLEVEGASVKSKVEALSAQVARLEAQMFTKDEAREQFSSVRREIDGLDRRVARVEDRRKAEVDFDRGDTDPPKDARRLAAR